MCQKGRLIHRATKQYVSRCPVCGATLRRADDGRIYCPTGQEEHIIEALVDHDLEIPNPNLKKVPGMRYQLVPK